MSEYEYFVSYYAYQQGLSVVGNASIQRSEPITCTFDLMTVARALEKDRGLTRVEIINWQLFPSKPPQIADEYLRVLVRLYEFARLTSENAVLRKRGLMGEERAREQGKADVSRCIFSIFGEAAFADFLQQIVDRSAFAYEPTGQEGEE